MCPLNSIRTPTPQIPICKKFPPLHTKSKTPFKLVVTGEGYELGGVQGFNGVGVTYWGWCKWWQLGVGRAAASRSVRASPANTLYGKSTMVFRAAPRGGRRGQGLKRKLDLDFLGKDYQKGKEKDENKEEVLGKGWRVEEEICQRELQN